MGNVTKKWIGASVPRMDGEEKVRGLTRFVGDLSLPRMWHGAAVRSETARGCIRGITFARSFDWSRVTVVTSKDIPGENVIPIIEHDMPCLASDRVAYYGEPVVLVAAPDLGTLEKARQSVLVEVDAEEPLLGIEKMVNLYKSDPGLLTELHSLAIEKGAVEKGLIEADVIVEGEYFTGPQEQGYLETQGVLATPLDGGMEILGSMQCPFYVRPAVAHVLGLAEEDVGVEQTPTGGAFGGKEDYPSSLASYAALLARKAARPVRMVLDRSEDMAFTPKRHASWTRIKAGVKHDGTLTALRIEFVLDGGAYTTLTPLVLSRGAIHAQGAYQCPNIRVTARAYRSNIPPAGAFRGFGAPQSLFAMESHMDEIAQYLGQDPLAMRRKNVILKGDATSTGQVLKESVGSKECLEAMVLACGYDERMREVERFNMSSKRLRRGLGTAIFWHGAGFIGSREKEISPQAELELLPGGVVEIKVASTELGQGALTALSQIVAQSCAIDVSFIRFPRPGTTRVPDSGPTVASRTTMIVGKLLERCGHDLVSEIERRLGGKPDGPKGADQALEQGPLLVRRTYKSPPGLTWSEENHHGDAYPAYSWGAVAVEVTVDPFLGTVRPLEVWCAVDIGKAVNPQAARAQVEGGLIQALGYGLLERLTLSDKGAFRETGLENYLMPTTTELPRLHVELIEFPSSHGPSGAKGVGELPMNGLAPAMGNAVRNALGVRVNALPLTRERVFEAWRA